MLSFITRMMDLIEFDSNENDRLTGLVTVKLHLRILTFVQLFHYVIHIFQNIIQLNVASRRIATK